MTDDTIVATLEHEQAIGVVAGLIRASWACVILKYLHPDEPTRDSPTVIADLRFDLGETCPWKTDRTVIDEHQTFIFSSNSTLESEEVRRRLPAVPPTEVEPVRG